jgi:hypothetical protein
VFFLCQCEVDQSPCAERDQREEQPNEKERRPHYQNPRIRIRDIGGVERFRTRQRNIQRENEADNAEHCDDDGR